MVNTLAYYDTELIMAEISFMIQTHGVIVIKLFFFVTDDSGKEASAFSLEKF